MFGKLTSNHIGFISLLKEGFYASGLNPNLIVNEEIGIDYSLECSYGVCDEPEQFIEKYEELLKAHEDTFVVTFTLITKKDQPPKWGWRWEKWGKYIGTKEPKADYLYDELEIDRVVIFQVWKVIL